MRVYVESILNCPPRRIWDALQMPSSLLKIIRPLFRFEPLPGETFPDRWVEGDTIVCRGYVFGLFAVGQHELYLERIDQAAMQIQSREHDQLVARWDHLIRVVDAPHGETRYSDEIEIEAGPLTIFVWLFAQMFYRHRQRKWRKIARQLAAESSADLMSADGLAGA